MHAGMHSHTGITDSDDDNNSYSDDDINSYSDDDNMTTCTLTPLMVIVMMTTIQYI